MKLSTYIKKLQELQRKYPEDLDVIYSCDEEGNRYDTVFFYPTPGHLDKFNEFCNDNEMSSKQKVNCICIN